ncbi:MAG: glycosyltransferase family 4 protein [Nitrososphaerales archaeon]
MSRSSIAIVSPSFFPMIGGIESYVHSVGKELVELGHEVHVYTPDSVLGRKIPNHNEQLDGIIVHRLDVRIDLSYRLRFWPDLLNELKRDAPDIIHVYSHDSYALLALMAARSGQVPFLVTTYGPLETHSNYGVVETALFRTYDSLVAPPLFRRCNLVMVRYPAIAHWLVSMHVARTKIRLEPSGIPKDALGQRDGSAFRVRHHIGGPLVLYLGRISSQKGVQYAVESIKRVNRRFPDARLMIVGPDYSGFVSVIRSNAAKLGVSESVVVLPPMLEEEAQLEALAACDVFVMPSSFEGFSQSVMKAMAQGRPVVVTNVGGLPYEVGYGKCGLISQYGDADSLADCILKLLGDPDLSRQLGAEGKERAQDFTFDELALRISHNYDQLA